MHDFQIMVTTVDLMLPLNLLTFLNFPSDWMLA